VCLSSQGCTDRSFSFCVLRPLRRIHVLLHSLGAQSSPSLGPQYPLLAGPTLAALAPGGWIQGTFRTAIAALSRRHPTGSPATTPLCAVGIDGHGRGAPARHAAWMPPGWTDARDGHSHEHPRRRIGSSCCTRAVAAANPLRCWRWFDRDTLNGAGEAALIAALVKRTVSRYPIDPSRVVYRRYLRRRGNGRCSRLLLRSDDR